MAKTIRIILAEDSPTVRRYLANLIEEAPDMEVVGEANNGEEAIRLVEELRPDVVSMDINMPEVDGLEATRRIMENTPTPIVVVSGLLDVDIHLSLKAIEAGALAVISKPPSRDNPTFIEKKRQLLMTLRAMADVRVISRRRPRLARDKLSDTQQSESKITDTKHPAPEIIVIGASTGGPSALLQFIKDMPHNLSIPIVIVQHMPDEFIKGFALWLDNTTPLQVSIAEHERILEKGTITIAPGVANLRVIKRNNQLMTQLSTDFDHSRYIPSVDVLFESVAISVGKTTLGIILTGMGDDGAKGLLAIRQAGGITMVQDESSSIVFGMPHAAIERGAAHHIVPLVNLASKVKKML